MDAAETQPARTSAIEWNAGAWFGSQIGASCWLGAAAIVLANDDLVAAAGPAVAFFASNLIGSAIWRNRSHVSAFRGFMGLLLTTGLAALAAVVWVDGRGFLPALWPMGAPSAVRPATCGALLIYPGLAALFIVQERCARKAAQLDQHSRFGPKDL